jgi:hypothetical protein
VVVPNAELFERAMQATGQMNRAEALMSICQSYLAHTPSRA